MITDDQFIRDALAESEFFVAAGYVPVNGKPAPSAVVSDPLPTLEAVGKLPPWARVAFAARCARRILPLLASSQIKNGAGPVTRVVDAVHAVERAAAKTDPEQVTSAWVDALTARKEFQDLGLALETAVADTVYRTALLAQRSGSIPLPQAGVIYKAITEPVWKLAAEIASALGDDITSQIRHDFESLVHAVDEQNWTDDTPVPPEVFGPMWDREPPPWWRDDVFAALPPATQTKDPGSARTEPGSK